MVGSFVTMTTLEKLGLIALLYGVALHTWHIPVALLIALALMLAGGALLLVGGHVTRWLVRTWPGVRWE